jgi:hypothetical protein
VVHFSFQEVRAQQRRAGATVMRTFILAILLLFPIEETSMVIVFSTCSDQVASKFQLGMKSVHDMPLFGLLCQLKSSGFAVH